MANKNRRVVHSEKVDVENIDGTFSKKRQHRYLLEIPFYQEKTRSKILTVILKNPSKANEKIADNSIRKCEEYIYQNFLDVSNINILNLYSYRETDVSLLKKELDTYSARNQMAQIKNDKVIQSVIALSDYIIVAWGTNTKLNKTKYEERVEEVLSFFDTDNIRHKVYEVVNPRGNREPNTPFHAQGWAYAHGNKKYFE